MNKQRWIWEPNRSIGPFVFGEPIPEDFYGFEYRIIPRGESDEETEQTFDLIEEGIWISTDFGLVESLETSQEIIYKGVDLIGMKTEDAAAFIGGDWEIEINTLGERMFNNDKLNIMLWEEDGVVDSAAVSMEYEDE